MSEETKTIITIGLLLFTLAAWLWPLLMGMSLELEERKKRDEPPEYDERQRIARLKAGNHTLFVLLGFLGVWTAADQLAWFPWTGSTLDMTLCALMLAWGVWASDCILHDAFTTWKDKRKNANAAALVYCVSMLMFVRSFCVSGYCLSWMPFVFACADAAALAGTAFYKARRERAEDAV